jgi:hypothetical protein
VCSDILEKEKTGPFEQKKPRLLNRNRRFSSQKGVAGILYR